ncbi:glycosyltransferase family 4 protein [Winogradskyella helgolandensis]|uniref:glycosyltransferase family 4 protein n=1 Tax=Winogradskyella helgolandensis TaxID=2697010 RepID=UPI0015CCA43C|nr:MraY family glycosyltransferase [Winogradskyella helgolandensis]
MIKILFEHFDPSEFAILWLIAAFILAFFMAYRTFPVILIVAEEKHLMDEPDSRSMHSNRTPTLGGIGIFLGVIVVMTIVGAFLNTKTLLLVMGGLTILFFLGLKDDLTVLSPGKKFIGQLFAAALLIVFTDTRIIGFSSILDVHTLPYWVSVGFTLFVYLLIINAYNLIDGVDGLAGTIALSVSIIFMYLFVQAGDLSLATIAMALSGSLLAFLRFNFSRSKKIFMGDTGSMIVGFLLAFFTISFINLAQVDETSDYYHAAPALACALLFYPFIDTLRIFFIRIVIHKTSPFKADKNHIHHWFIKIGYSHLMTTILICGINFVIVCIAFSLLQFQLNIQIICLLLYGVFFYTLPFIVHRFKNKATIKENKMS